MTESKSISRRNFIYNAGLVLAGAALDLPAAAALKKEPVIDIHQHIHYHARTDEQLLAHQQAMGVTRSILLPAGRPVNSPATHNGASNGLQANAGGNAECYLFAREHRKAFLFGANEVPEAKDAIAEIERYLKRGAVVIGELKFGVECDAPSMQRIYELAQHYQVPVLMHWQFGMFNHGFERFIKMLEKYPSVNFIGHAQSWWAGIDKAQTDPKVLYPAGPVTAGGITDRYLSDYPNMFGDLSAGSGLRALTRDEDHGRQFLAKHQDKLLFGSDYEDAHGSAALGCTGALDIALVRKLAASKSVERKLLYENASKLFKIR